MNTISSWFLKLVYIINIINFFANRQILFLLSLQFFYFIYGARFVIMQCAIAGSPDLKY